VLSYADALRLISPANKFFFLNSLTDSADYYYIPECAGYDLRMNGMRYFGKLEGVQDLGLPYDIIPNLL